MNISQAVIKRIEELCKERNLTINALSNISGVTQSTVNDIVKGTTYNAGIATIKKLCDGLGISIRDFFDSDLFTNIEQEIK
jgi:transcriptional regulator with XRE-family HTH domain